MYECIYLCRWMVDDRRWNNTERNMGGELEGTNRGCDLKKRGEEEGKEKV